MRSVVKEDEFIAWAKKQLEERNIGIEVFQKRAQIDQLIAELLKQFLDTSLQVDKGL
jgi:hypothetical protein